VLYFYKINCSFRGRRNTLDIVIVILYGGYRILEILCCGFFFQIALAGDVMCRQGADSVIGVEFSEIYSKLKETSFEISILR
jgi:hypothetical protein